jgi:NAD(P) transhydrogenase
LIPQTQIAATKRHTQRQPPPNLNRPPTAAQRMLDMFKRPEDPIEYNNLYAIPGEP